MNSANGNLRNWGTDNESGGATNDISRSMRFAALRSELPYSPRIHNVTPTVSLVDLPIDLV